MKASKRIFNKMIKSKPPSKGLKWQLMNLDMFGAPIGFNWGGGKGKYDTFVGALSSVFIFILTILYIVKVVKVTYLQQEVPAINI